MFRKGALIITYTILGVPYYDSSIMGPETLFDRSGPYISIMYTEIIFGSFDRKAGFAHAGGESRVCPGCTHFQPFGLAGAISHGS